MGSESDDPTGIRSIAVSTDDLVAALEATRRSGRDAVLRVTPPFSGRMRARLHVSDVDEYDAPTPVHVDPTEIVADTAPDYPSPAETEDTIRRDPDVEYTRELHHERHENAVADWREAVPEHVVDTVTLETSAGPHDVAVTLLG